MTARKPRLSLCMIVRDSARTLAACLDSIRPWVDEMIVVDTGSTDDTRQIARDRGAEVFEYPWIDDFSAARNESLRHAHGEWLFWMDSDDTIDDTNGRALRALVDGMHELHTLGYVVQVHCPSDFESEDEGTTVVDHVKLIRNDARLRFEGRIHEQVLPSIRRLGGEVGWTELFVVHSGADHSPQGKQRKIERDLRILKLDLAERPDHPFVLFNLGMTHEDLGDYAEAERWLQRCLTVSDAGDSHVRKAYALLAACLEQLGRLDQAREVLQRGLQLFTEDRELLFRQGLTEHRAGELAAAKAAYERLLRVNGVRHFTSIDRGITGFKARHNLALVHHDRGECCLAELQWRYVLKEQDRFAPAWRGLGTSLIDQNKLTTLEVLLDELAERPESDADRLWLVALAAEKRGEYELVRPLLERAIAADTNHLHARQDLCRWLYHHGTLGEAEVALRELVHRTPENGATWHNLGVVLSRQGKTEEAIHALEESLRLRPAAEGALQELCRLRALHQGMQQPPAESVESGRSDDQAQQAIGGLPACYARRAIAGESKRFHCLHPKVHSLNQIVSSSVCSVCTRWSEGSPEHLRPESDLASPIRGLTCRFIGRQIGLRTCPACAGNVRVKAFACSHPAHAETTLEACRSCVDYLATQPHPLDNPIHNG